MLLLSTESSPRSKSLIDEGASSVAKARTTRMRLLVGLMPWASKS